jgi:hypothetical protein
MPINFFNKKYIILILMAVNTVVLSQHGFNMYLSQDSVYRYNTSLSELDSILKNNSATIDTSFSNSFGRAEIINLDQLIYFALNNNPEIIYLTRCLNLSLMIL